MSELPEMIQQIRDIEARRRSADWYYAEHTVQFSYGTGANQAELATFGVHGPIAIPAVGQVISLHGTYVKVIEVDTAYEVTEGGRPAVFASVQVDEASLFPADTPEER